MIRNSFIFLEKVGPILEKNIWKQGIKDWKDFSETPNIRGISNKRKHYYDRKLKQAQSALYSFNSAYFSNILPSTETWRLYEFFKDECLYLDIEIANKKGDIAVIGLSDGVNAKTVVNGFNMHKNLITQELKKAKLIITFNGSVFDIPVIKKYFSDIVPNIPHIDLRFLCARLGLHGSLKEIEPIIGIKRPKYLKGNPIDLWKAFFASGDREYLELLVQYNEEDTLNLKPLMEFCYKQLKQDYITQLK